MLLRTKFLTMVTEGKHSLHTCQWDYCPQRHSTHSQFEMISSGIHLPSSSATMLAQAFRSPTKVTGHGFTPACCISGYNSNAFCPCPHFTYPRFMAFQATTSQMGIMLNTLKASSRLPHLVNILMRALLTPTSELEPLQTICSWIVLPSSSAATLALTAEDFWDNVSVGTPYVLAMEDGSFRMYYLGVVKFEGDNTPQWGWK